MASAWLPLRSVASCAAVNVSGLASASSGTPPLPVTHIQSPMRVGRCQSCRPPSTRVRCASSSASSRRAAARPSAQRSNHGWPVLEQPSQIRRRCSANARGSAVLRSTDSIGAPLLRSSSACQQRSRTLASSGRTARHGDNRSNPLPV
ncbi:hypothetical protein G6F22_018049 [Rhizopus arrhizus]|nr:hypothetical protein G6F22_018049 [Rhizopus arrhizus]